MSDDLAVLYNDRSPMENHHLAASFQLMNSEEYNFMPKVRLVAGDVSICLWVWVCVWM